MKKTAIVIFIKNPDLGEVKKRLAESVGAEIALEVYKKMLDHTQMITKSLSADKYLFYDKVAVANDSWPDDVYIKKLQRGADMATRLSNACKEIFDMGYEHVVIIGSDCLELDERIIRLAFRQLEHFDCVLGPTKDGGFYLIGTNQFNPEIFNLEKWGTPELTTQTLKTIHHLNKTHFMLSELSSVVTIADLGEDLNLLIK